MPVVPFIPMIASGIGALVSKKVGQKATASAAQRSPEEAAALSGETNAANTLGQTGQSLVGQGRDTLGKSAGYYGSLLGGNRAAMANATAAPRAQLQEGIRGAQTQLGASGIRGAAKDQIAGNIMRQGAGQVAGLTTGVQPWAAGQLAGVGGGLLQTGAPMLGQSANVFSNMLGQGYQNRVYSRQEGEKTGNALGGFIADAGKVAQNAFSGDDTGGSQSSSSFSRPGSLPTVGNPGLPTFSGWAPPSATWKPTDWSAGS